MPFLLPAAGCDPAAGDKISIILKYIAGFMGFEILSNLS